LSISLKALVIEINALFVLNSLIMT